MIDIILNLIYPPRCIFCDSILYFMDNIEVCNKCFNKLPLKNENKICYRKFCNMDFDSITCLFNYGGIVKEALHRYKYEEKSFYYRAWANLIVYFTKKMTKFDEFDIILSVPLHKDKLKKRGYNQSALISKKLSKLIKIPEKSNVFKRIKDTESQMSLDRAKREKNIKNAFKITDRLVIENSKIILIDDILTTASTIKECSRILKKSGAKKIHVIVLASGNELKF